jgi:hypothetical protein
MGWAYCGIHNGREIGYGIKAKCDFLGCSKDIDRGLAYACGGHHLDGDNYCDKYFCYEHLIITQEGQRCPTCAKLIPEEEGY